MNLRHVSFGVLSAALCLVALEPAGLAQTTASQTVPPTFRSTVDLLTLDTSVRDKGGVVVPDLQASDFTVTIDGRARKVVSAVFFKADPAAGSRLSGGARPTPQHVSNDGATSGRVLVLALDARSIIQGKEKALLDTAARMLDALSPADAVGLIELPAGGPSIEATRDRRVIAGALKDFRGRAPREAEQMAAGGNIPTPSPQANSIRQFAEGAQSDHVLLDLAALVRRMSVVRAPRSVVFISGGFEFDPKVVGQYAELQRAAAESRISLYTVLVEQVGYEGSRGETRPDAAVNPALSEGLATIASRTGGMFFTGIARAVGVFDRLASEVTSFYRLGFESSPADADGKEHDIKVRVSRPGVDVRGPAHVAVARPPKTPAPRDSLLLALQQPTDVPDVPIAVTAYSTHPAGSAIQLLISAEIGASDGAAATEWGLAVNQSGKNVVTRRGRIPAGSARPRVISTTVEIPPGEYRLRVAAVDAEDRIGVLETAITAGYQTTGATVAGDLILGVAAGAQLEPRRRIAQSEELTAMLEIVPGAGSVPGGTLQLIPGGSARSALNAPLTVRPPASAGEPAILEARAALGSVRPGRYTASAVVVMDGQPSTRIDRVIEVTAAPPVAVPPDVVPVAAEAPVALASAAMPAPANADLPDELLRRVGAYVEHYGGQASLLVGVEQYSQSVTRTAVLTPPSRAGVRGMAGNSPVDSVAMGPTSVTERRRLASEFALVASASTSGGWLGYRDVIEVDGKRVADGHDRLQAIFRSDAPDLVEARRIADESARYNIGPVSRNFNLPTTPVFFFHSNNLARFTFGRKGRERIEDVETVVIDFREARSPTLIMNSAGKDVPASGTLWVNSMDGAIVRTRLELEKFDDAGSRAVIEVQYRKDPVLAMWVPSRMTESYSGSSPTGGSKETAKTEAIYRDFKRFQTSVKIK